MGWLIGPTIFAFFMAFIVVKVFDHVFASMMGGAGSTVRVGLFVGTWTAVTAKTGMRGFSKKVRQLRAGNASVLKALTRGEKP